jgi:hypothetical protein
MKEVGTLRTVIYRRTSPWKKMASMVFDIRSKGWGSGVDAAGPGCVTRLVTTDEQLRRSLFEG